MCAKSIGNSAAGGVASLRHTIICPKRLHTPPFHPVERFKEKKIKKKHFFLGGTNNINYICTVFRTEPRKGTIAKAKIRKNSIINIVLIN